MEENKPEENLTEETNSSLQTETTETEPRENISVTDAMTGVLSAPTDTFEEVRISSRKNYWLLPMIILIVVSVASTFLLFNDEDLASQIRDKQRKGMMENMEKKVKAGEMSKEQMDKAVEQADKFMSKSGPFYYVSITLFPAIGIFVVFLILGLVFWGGTKIFKGTAGYGNILSVMGLSGIISAIDAIVSIVLSILMGRLVNLGPSLLVTAASVGENMDKFLNHFDILGIWYLVVMAVGFAKVSQIDNAKSFILVFGLWLIWICLTSFANIRFMGM